MSRSGRRGEGEGAHERIRKVVRRIPGGRVATYGQVAEVAGGVTPRMVGYAMAAVQPGDGVPWHRVINARGAISLPPGRGREEQRAMLESEGVVFRGNGTVDLRLFGWTGPGSPS